MGKFASLLEGLDVPDLFHISKPGHPVQLSVPLINLPYSVKIISIDSMTRSSFALVIE